MKKIIVVFIAILIGCGVDCFGQGKVRRPSKKQSQTNSETSHANPKVSEPDGYINGHGYVDLGLPSGIKWATTNLGANSPSEYGDYYAWGEISSKSSYTRKNSLTYGKTKAALESEGIINSQGILNKKYDAASANWGGSWCIPIMSELEELVKKCKWKWCAMGGKSGYMVTGPNGNSIFLAAGGYSEGASHREVNKYGIYWSASVARHAWGLYFYPGFNDMIEDIAIEDGMTIRAVSK